MTRTSRSTRPRAVDDDLEKILTREGALDVELARAIILAAASAVGEAHDRGVVHGELAPHRIVVRARPPDPVAVRVRGLDKKAGATGKSALFRPPAYLAPEQLGADAAIDPRTDVWALGVILHEALTGVLPFRAGSVPELCAAIVASPPTRVRTQRPEVPAALEAIVAQCLRKDPAARYPSMHALVAALRGVTSVPAADATIVDEAPAVASHAAIEANTLAMDSPRARFAAETIADEPPIGVSASIEANTAVAPRSSQLDRQLSVAAVPPRASPAVKSFSAASTTQDRPRRGSDPTRTIAVAVASLAVVALAATWWTTRSAPPAPGPATSSGPAMRAPVAAGPSPIAAPPIPVEADPADAAPAPPQPPESAAKIAPAPEHAAVAHAAPSSVPRADKTAAPEKAPPAETSKPVAPPAPHAPPAAADPYGGRK